MRVALTGASGFIGQHLARALHRRGDIVLPLSTGRPPQALGAWFEKEQPEALLHLGWYVPPADYVHGRPNLDALSLTTQLWAAALDHRCSRLLGVGSCLEYGPREEVRTEDLPVDPRSLYGATKVAAQIVGKALSERSGAAFAWARIFHVYGPGEAPGRLIPAAIRALRAGEVFPVSPGAQLRDWTAVEDVAEALCQLLHSASPGVFNVCTGAATGTLDAHEEGGALPRGAASLCPPPLTLRAFLLQLGVLLGRPELLHFGGRPYAAGEEMVILGDSTRLRSLGWAPKISLEAGLKGTLETTT